MYCPRCGQERTSEATNFCSRCGFLLTIASELIPTGGVLPPNLLPATSGHSPRMSGFKQGIFLILLAAVIFPVLGIISVFLFNAPPWPAGVVLFLLAGAGLLRITYALMFEPKAAPLPEGSRGASLSRHGWTETVSPQLTADQEPQFLGSRTQFVPAVGLFRDTNELEPTSVTEGTTKLLEIDSDNS